MLSRKRLRTLSVGMLTVQRAAGALDLNIDDPASIRAAAKATAANMMSNYHGHEPGQIPGKLPGTWWEGGAMFMTLIQYWYWTGDDTYNDITRQGILWQKGRNDFFPRNSSTYLGNDDQMFWALAAVTAAELGFPEGDPGVDELEEVKRKDGRGEEKKKDPSWLSLAQGVFNTQIPRWDESACGGGMRWQVWPYQGGYTTKNAITNGGLFQLAARLGRYTKNETYVYWAEKIWDWSVTTPLLRAGGEWTIADTTSMGNQCHDHGDQQWTYNYGAYIGGAAYMYNLTNGGEKWRAGIDGLLETTWRKFFKVNNTMSEIWCERSVTCDRNEDMFKGFLSSWLTFTTTIAPWTADAIIPRIQQSALGASRQCHYDKSCGRRWNKDAWDGTSTMESDMSALSVLSSAMRPFKPGAQPLTPETGAFSQSNPNAGMDEDFNPQKRRNITDGDRAGASLLTVLFVALWIWGFIWTVFGNDQTGPFFDMVFLRLTVKVYPRDQAPPSNTFSFRSLLGDRERDDVSRTSSSTTVGKPASFLIVLENSEDVTLGGLAGMIREKWRKLRPNVEPLTIKKLLDDDHESDDLDTDMTVADVFVDKGKAKADGLDQRRTVRVIQKPAGGDVSPVRFPSVTQDWDAAAEHYEIQRQKKLKQEAEFAVNKLGRIEEEGSGSRSPVGFDEWAQWTPKRTHRRDIPVFSVEKNDEIPASPSQPAPHSSIDDLSHEVNGVGSTAAQEKRLGSEELGDSPRSSRATTPRKKSTPRRDSTPSRGSKQPEKGDAPVSDSPGLQLAREHTHSVSPQKAPAPLAEERQSESESESDGGSENESDKENQDKDGDTAMRDQSSPRKSKSPVMTRARATAVETPAAGPRVTEQSRKRKNSTDQTSPNKEPRLDRTTPPPHAPCERRDRAVSPGTPRFSPSGKRLGGSESFSGVARRLSFSERESEPPSQGLGLGITRSPPKRPSVGVESSQKSTQSTKVVPENISIPPSSAPVARRGSISKNVSMPDNLQTPADKVKDVHSALRKDTSADRSSVRRSVSFVDGDELSIIGSQPAPTSTPMDGAKPTKSKAAATASSEKRRSSSAMVFPPGVSMEKIARFEREAEAKFAQQKKEETEFQEKIKAAEKDKTKKEYCNKLKEAFKTWKAIINDGKAQPETTVTRLRTLLAKQQTGLKEMEASFRGKSKEPQPFLESPNSQQSSKIDAMASSKKTSTPTVNRDRKSPAANNSSWNPINYPGNNAKSATPIANGTAKSPSKSTPKEPVAKTVATKTVASKQTKPASQSQNSTSDELELPAMKVQARTNANNTKKSNPQTPVEVCSTTSSASSSEGEEEESSEESSGSESESGSGSGSGSGSESESESSDSEPETKTNNKKPIPTSTTSKSQLSKPTSPPSAQRTTKSPAPSQPQSQSLSWWPASQPTTKSTRLSLKSIKGEVANQAKAQAAAKAKAAPQKRNAPRRDMYSPPSSDSDETESESSSESEEESGDDKSSSGSDGDDGKGKEKGKKGHDSDKNKKLGRSQSPISVGDEGDIMSSGQVQKLRTARVGGR
ncbi:glycosyl hydrolase family 76-domain-containing protein [Aspergillus oleicola]